LKKKKKPEIKKNFLPSCGLREGTYQIQPFRLRKKGRDPEEFPLRAKRKRPERPFGVRKGYNLPPVRTGKREDVEKKRSETDVLLRRKKSISKGRKT